MCFDKLLWKFNFESFHFGASKFYQSLRFKKHRILLYFIWLYKDFRTVSINQNSQTESELLERCALCLTLSVLFSDLFAHHISCKKDKGAHVVNLNKLLTGSLQPQISMLYMTIYEIKVDELLLTTQLQCVSIIIQTRYFIVIITIKKSMLHFCFHL